MLCVVGMDDTILPGMMGLARGSNPEDWKVREGVPALDNDWLRIEGEWVPGMEDPLTPPAPCTEAIRGPKQALSSSGPSRVLGRPRFLFSSPFTDMKLFSELVRPVEAVVGRPIICIGGGPVSLGMAGLAPGEGPVGTLAEGAAAAAFFFSSPDTSARPFTFRFSAVFNNEDNLSWETLISPLYIKSTMAAMSAKEVSFRITIWLGSLKLTKSCSK